MLGRFLDLERLSKITAAESSPESLRTRAEELLDARRLEEAVQILSALIAVKPDSHWGYRMRGVVRSELGDIEGGGADLDRSVELAPDRAAAWARRAELRASGPDLASATFDAERALELDPESTAAEPLGI